MEKKTDNIKLQQVHCFRTEPASSAEIGQIPLGESWAFPATDFAAVESARVLASRMSSIKERRYATSYDRERRMIIITNEG